MKALVNSGKGHIKEHVRICIITKSTEYYRLHTCECIDHGADIYYWNDKQSISVNVMKLAGRYYSCIILDGEFTQTEIEFINTRCK